MSVDEYRQIIAAEQYSQVKAVIAHYRHALPAFVKIGEMIKKGVVGLPQIAKIQIFSPLVIPILQHLIKMTRVCYQQFNNNLTIFY